MAKSIISKIFSTTFLLVLMIMISYTAESALGDILDLDISKLNVGHTGSIAGVDPTRVAGFQQGGGQERIGTKDLHVGKNGNTAKAGEARVFVAQKGHGIADAHTRDIHVGKDGSIANVQKNGISVGKKGHGVVDAGKVQAHVLKGPHQ
ncbi:hypothetical protein MKW98_018269 [Papaver atlanticum]|uniref:Uncharacterized protein n=1 Tax=Papaver atlanticum TaxID=357466 RepID=A0AAD4S4H9_9MAGN|nr:hypothetical protein MKW98_018269 [Papaver atlanticum]